MTAPTDEATAAIDHALVALGQPPLGTNTHFVREIDAPDRVELKVVKEGAVPLRLHLSSDFQVDVGGATEVFFEPMDGILANNKLASLVRRILTSRVDITLKFGGRVMLVDFTDDSGEVWLRNRYLSAAGYRRRDGFRTEQFQPVYPA